MACPSNHNLHVPQTVPTHQKWCNNIHESGDNVEQVGLCLNFALLESVLSLMIRLFCVYITMELKWLNWNSQVVYILGCKCHCKYCSREFSIYMVTAMMAPSSIKFHQLQHIYSHTVYTVQHAALACVHSCWFQGLLQAKCHVIWIWMSCSHCRHYSTHTELTCGWERTYQQ